MNINFNIKINNYISKVINKSINNNNYIIDNNDNFKQKKNKVIDSENKITNISQNLIIRRELSDNEIIVH